jgi:hypothetical protein
VNGKSDSPYDIWEFLAFGNQHAMALFGEQRGEAEPAGPAPMMITSYLSLFSLKNSAIAAVGIHFPEAGGSISTISDNGFFVRRKSSPYARKARSARSNAARC